MYIVIAILLFGILIAVHELGHFAAAKLSGVKVNEFAIGMGPAIFKKQKGETLYSLRLLPIGGYCAMEGEDEDTGDERSFSRQAWWKRLIILAAGSFMNFVFGFLVIIVVFAGGAYSTTTVTGFMEGFPNEGEHALMVGDEIYEIDGHRIYFTPNVTQFLQRGGTTHEITVIRDGEKVELAPMDIQLAEYPESEGLKYGFYFGEVETGVFATLKYSWYSSITFVRDVWLALSDLVAGAIGIEQLSGPVGIVDAIGDVGESSETVEMAIRNILYFGAFIAINLAVMNLLPLPALDGGRIFFMAISGLWYVISRKKLNPKYEGYIHAAGLISLLGLAAYVMYNDVVRLISG